MMTVNDSTTKLEFKNSFLCTYIVSILPLTHSTSCVFGPLKFITLSLLSHVYTCIYAHLHEDSLVNTHTHTHTHTRVCVYVCVYAH